MRNVDIKPTPTPWKIIPVSEYGNPLYILKDGKNVNITNDMFSYKSDWWDYFNHAVHCVNNLPIAISAFNVLTRKIDEMLLGKEWGDEITGYDLNRLKEYVLTIKGEIDFIDQNYNITRKTK